jgi:hypothetical protein
MTHVPATKSMGVVNKTEYACTMLMTAVLGRARVGILRGQSHRLDRNGRRTDSHSSELFDGLFGVSGLETLE